jgi:hypothetical protein
MSAANKNTTLADYLQAASVLTMQQHHSERTKKGIAAAKQRKNSRAPKVINFTHAQLADIVGRQGGWDFNRQIEPAYLQDWPANKTHRLHFLMYHQHRHGVRCEDHVRTELTRGDRHIACIDMPISYWERLARA